MSAEEDYDAMCQLVNEIAKPLADWKLAKKIYKVVKKAKQKESIRTGLSDVQKAIRKGEKGIVILAGNVTPIDVYSHIPAICEEKELPYVYIPSREHLGLLSGYKRPCIAMLVKTHEDYSELHDEISTSVHSLTIDVGSEEEGG